MIERPDAFRKFARLDDETLDKLLKELEDESPSTGCNNFRNEAGSDRNILLEPPRVLSLEAALEYIEENARVEVTPSQIRLRQVLLQEVHPYRAARRRA